MNEIERFGLTTSAQNDLVSGNKNLIHTAELNYLNDEHEFIVIEKAEVLDSDEFNAVLQLLFKLGQRILEMEKGK